MFLCSPNKINWNSPDFMNVVKCQGIPTIEHVIVNKDDKDKKLPKYNLFVEG